MYQGKLILGVITARGGSKGVPRKNIKLLNGKPLIGYSIEHLQQSKFIDAFVVSSEDEEILRLATELGSKIVRRPLELAQDDTATPPVLSHALEQACSENCTEYDYIVTIQPTSPLRKPETIDRAIVQCIDRGHDSLMTVYEDSHPYGRIDERGEFVFLDPSRRRQERKPIYRENGAVYVTHVSVVKKRTAVIGSNLGVLPSDEMESLDIDTELDFLVAEAILKQQL